MIQKELFRTSVLAKLMGCLVLIQVKPFTEGPFICPECKGKNFRKAPYGWLDCCTDECSFSLLESHVNEILNQ